MGIVVVGFTIALLQIGSVKSQVPSYVGPFNVDLGAVITNTAAGPGVVNSASLNNVDQAGAVCTYLATATTGNPTVNFGIQGFDTGTNSWFNYVVSNGITAINQPVPIIVWPNGLGIAGPFGSQTYMPAGVQVVGLPLPRTFRVSETISGSGSPTVTAKIGCVTLR